MEERTPEELEWYMERFTTLIQKCQDEHQLSLKFPKETAVRVEKGRKYWKIFVDSHDEWSGPRSLIFGFVRRKDGAILRAANMKAPETRTKNPVRGYIWDEMQATHLVGQVLTTIWRLDISLTQKGFTSAQKFSIICV